MKRRLVTLGAIASNSMGRLVGMVNDRANVVLGYPILAFLDWAGAKCGQWDYAEQREKSKEVCRRIWSRRARKSKVSPNNLVVAAIRENPNAFKPLVDAIQRIDRESRRNK